MNDCEPGKLHELLNNISLNEEKKNVYCNICLNYEADVYEILYYYNIKRNNKYIRIPKNELICDYCINECIFNCYSCNKNFLISSITEGYKDRLLTEKIILCNECHNKYACSICNYLENSLISSRCRYC